MSEAPTYCRLAGCGGPPSKVCLEGLSFDECKNVIREEAPAITTPEPPSPPEEDEPHQLIRTGNDANLSAATCDALLRERGGVVVAIIAGPDAGKTTFIATLYELLLRRKMSQFGFAGSETIRGLEERCHLSRANSELESPDTKRTPIRANAIFAHLKVAVGSRRIDLVFADRSGEHFIRTLDTPATIGTFGEVVRADVRVILVDGYLLAANPHAEIARARQLFLALQQSDLVNGRPLLVVATKADLLGETESARSLTRLKSLVDEFRRRAPKADIRSFTTAARPRPGETDFGAGFDQVLDSLIPSEPEQQFALPWPHIPDAAGMDRLLTAWAQK